MENVFDKRYYSNVSGSGTRQLDRDHLVACSSGIDGRCSRCVPSPYRTGPSHPPPNALYTADQRRRRIRPTLRMQQLGAQPVQLRIELPRDSQRARPQIVAAPGPQPCHWQRPQPSATVLRARARALADQRALCILQRAQHRALIVRERGVRFVRAEVIRARTRPRSKAAHGNAGPTE